MIILKVNMATNRNYYSQILTAGCMKLELKMLAYKEMFAFCKNSDKLKYHLFGK